MHLQRIQVPDFRVLKDVDISFEKEFTPRIFPLGSQNGGGKSTLLQLILAFAIGSLGGFIWSRIIRSTGAIQLQYFNGINNSKDLKLIIKTVFEIINQNFN
jgi:predicted ATP-binding protein involved in virulence